MRIEVRFNALNQPIDSDLEYDRNGNLIRKGDITYRYDILDRLIEISNQGEKCVYTYDESNRRLSANGKRFLYRGFDEIGLYEGETLKEFFRLLGQGMGSEAGASLALELKGEVFAPIHDHNGNLSALYNSSGELVSSHRFSAFGEVQIEGEELSPWLYSGKRWDQEAQLYSFGRRFYDPKTHRWLSADPIKFDGGANLYAYVLNNPLTHLDAYGLSPINGLSPGFFHQYFLMPVVTLLTLPGLGVEFIGADFIPIPLVRDVVECAGKLLQGQSLEGYEMAHKRNHTCNG